jgi:serine/threonine protein kinase
MIWMAGKPYIGMVFELCGRGSLYKSLHQNPGKRMPFKEKMRCASCGYCCSICSYLLLNLSISFMSRLRVPGCLGVRTQQRLHCQGKHLDLARQKSVVVKPFSVRKIWRLFHRYALEVARGMSYIHAKGIIHRDLNSRNILLTDQGHAKVCCVRMFEQIHSAHISLSSWTLRTPKCTHFVVCADACFAFWLSTNVVPLVCRLQISGARAN